MIPRLQLATKLDKGVVDEADVFIPEFSDCPPIRRGSSWTFLTLESALGISPASDLIDVASELALDMRWMLGTVVVVEGAG